MLFAWRVLETGGAHPSAETAASGLGNQCLVAWNWTPNDTRVQWRINRGRFGL